MPLVRRRPSNPCAVGVRASGDGEKDEQVKEFVYLSSLFTNDGKQDRDIERRVNVGNKVNGALFAIINSKSVLRQTRLAIHNGILIPALMYGIESWTLRNLYLLENYWDPYKLKAHFPLYRPTPSSAHPHPSPLPLHQPPPSSIRYLISTQDTSNAQVIPLGLRVSMVIGDQLLFDGSNARLPLDLL
ncbi:hypothetical protein EVAR_60003_1 [Eumeta japonica]|uniref:Uncharacterized protein n=1 Tax=Eumeta variegata TaxID=151549 RepID=A0A4C1ZFG4_EUMVA|nr:hypothetical protein EVAR_60003_1 [Eumeta japonica]